VPVTGLDRCPLPSRVRGRLPKSAEHAIEDDLAEDWLDDWVGAGIAELEDYLSKHARFIDYLETHEAA